MNESINQIEFSRRFESRARLRYIHPSLRRFGIVTDHHQSVSHKLIKDIIIKQAPQNNSNNSIDIFVVCVMLFVITAANIK